MPAYLPADELARSQSRNSRHRLTSAVQTWFLLKLGQLDTALASEPTNVFLSPLKALRFPLELVRQPLLHVLAEEAEPTFVRVCSQRWRRVEKRFKRAVPPPLNVSLLGCRQLNDTLAVSGVVRVDRILL